MAKSVLDPTLPFASESRPDKLEPELSPEFKAWRAAPTPQTSGALLQRLRPILSTALQPYGGAQAGALMQSKAKTLALQSLDRYDPSRGSLRTHLLSNLRGLQRHSAQQQSIISLPERVSIDRRHLLETEEQLRDSLGRDPSTAEIADRSGLSMRRIAHVRQAQAPTAEGSLTREDEAGEVNIPASTVPGAKSNAWLDFIYYDLRPIDQAIMDFGLGLHGRPKRSQTEIAKQLGLSVGAINQRAARIQQMMDEEATRQ